MKEKRNNKEITTISKTYMHKTHTTYTKRVGLYFSLIYTVRNISNQNYLVSFEMVKMMNGET